MVSRVHFVASGLRYSHDFKSSSVVALVHCRRFPLDRYKRSYKRVRQDFFSTENPEVLSGRSFAQYLAEALAGVARDLT
jgi:hypothetical protein